MVCGIFNISGLIFVPGATIAGDAYIPLMESVQAHYPGSLWIAATTEWNGDMPNPLEIGGQLSGTVASFIAISIECDHLYY